MEKVIILIQKFMSHKLNYTAANTTLLSKNKKVNINTLPGGLEDKKHSKFFKNNYLSNEPKEIRTK